MYLRVQKGYKTVQAKQKLKVTPIGEKISHRLFVLSVLFY